MVRWPAVISNLQSVLVNHHFPERSILLRLASCVQSFAVGVEVSGKDSAALLNDLLYVQLSCQSLSLISKKLFRPGGMTPSEWTRSIRADRDILVEAYSAPGTNSTRHGAYRTPMAVSPVLFALSVSNFKRTLWR